MFVVGGAYSRDHWQVWGNRLRAAMDQADCSEKELAYAMRITPPQLTRQLAGADSLSLTRLAAAAAIPGETGQRVRDVWRWFALGIIDALDFPSQVNAAVRIQKRMASMSLDIREELSA